MSDKQVKKLDEIEVIIERFKIVEAFPDCYPSITDIQLDGKTINLEHLVHIANQLARALNDRGCYFEVRNNESN